ncbi:hypothetical protein MHBO_001908 [Bonamia ostreae]|uniref:Uncharacterized protein n=1 Tax=Bonamia ostreae TaxID=126728 RepID=A0ABV2AKQ6_9EUKA
MSTSLTIISSLCLEVSQILSKIVFLKISTRLWSLSDNRKMRSRRVSMPFSSRILRFLVKFFRFSKIWAPLGLSPGVDAAKTKRKLSFRKFSSIIFGSSSRIASMKETSTSKGPLYGSYLETSRMYGGTMWSQGDEFKVLRLFLVNLLMFGIIAIEDERSLIWYSSSCFSALIIP